MFAGFGDFAFYEMKLKGAHLVAGFGRIVDLKAGDAHRSGRRGDAGGRPARDRRAHEQGPCRDLPALCGQASRRADGDWRCVGCDPEGLDLQSGRMGLRLPFPQRVTQPGVLRAVLKQMADKARAGVAARTRCRGRFAAPNRSGRRLVRLPVGPCGGANRCADGHGMHRLVLAGAAITTKSRALSG